MPEGAGESGAVRFGVFTFHPDTRTLSRDGSPIALQDHPAKILTLLLEAPGEVVTRARIQQELWPGDSYGEFEAGVNTAISKLRSALRDSASRPLYIETIPKTGYRFAAPVAHVGKPPERAELPAPVPATLDVAGHPTRDATGVNAVAAAPGRMRPVLLGAAVIAIVAAVAAGWWLRRSGPLQLLPLVLEPLPGMPPRGVTAAAVSPDGTLLAYAPVEGPLAIRRLRDGHTIELPSPPDLAATRIAWFSDEKELLVSGATAGQPAAIWRLPAVGAAPPQLIWNNGRDAVPSPNGRQIAFLSTDGGLIAVTNRDGGEHHSVRAAAAGTAFSSLLWSPGGKRLSYMVLRTAPGMPGTDPKPSFETVEIESGRVIANVAGLGLYGGAVLADGRIAGLPWAYPANSHGGELLEIRMDPASGEIVNQLRRPMPYSWDGAYSSFSASRDGSAMALVAESPYQNLHAADIQRVQTAGGERVSLMKKQRLTFDQVEDYPHAWTRDSREIIFESNRSSNGLYQLFRLSLDRPHATRLISSEDADVLPQGSPNGGWILFRRHRDGVPPRLMRVPVSGGSPEQVMQLSPKPAEEFRCGSGSRSRCVIRSLEGDQFVYRELDPLKGSGRLLARTALTAQLLLDWDLSPDGTTLAIPGHDPGVPRVRLLRLDAPDGNGHRVIEIKGMQSLNAAAWSAGGEGLFLTGSVPPGGVVVYCDLEGNTQKLLDTARATFVVPSPDGKKIVFPDRVSSKTVQILKAP